MRRPILTGKYIRSAIAVILGIAALILLLRAARSGQVTQADTGLPSLEITLADVSLEELNAGTKDERYEGNSLVINSAGFGGPSAEKTVEIKGRGNNSWKMPKRSYQIRFDEKESLFGMEPAKKWVLLANYADASLMRNRLMLDLAGELMDYVPDSQYVDLYVDGNYLGNYLLCEKIEIGTGRVELTDRESLLVELDNYYYWESEDRFQSSVSGSWFILKDSVADDLDQADSIAEKAFAGLEDDINRFEELLYTEEKDWDAISSMIDVESFISYYFLEEFAENSDSCRTSIYLYRDGPDDTLHMGPVWDFDKAVGYSKRQKYGGDPEADYVSRIEDYMGTDRNTTWFTELFQIPEFQEAACSIYEEKIEAIFLSAGERIDAYSEEIRQSAAMNSEIWDISDIPVNCDHEPYEYTCWEESVEGLRQWVEERVSSLSARFCR